jgi:YD repeat-containing protein
MASLLAGLFAFPLLLPNVWTGFSVALSDPVLAAVSPVEAPLSIRSTGAVWAAGVLLVWFALAHRSRRVVWWEAALVLLGAAAALVRAGNLWLFGLAMLVPLARQLAPNGWLGAVIGAACLTVAIATLVVTRPPAPPIGFALNSEGAILADYRWAAALHAPGAGGLRSEPDTFWLDYLRVVNAHERWTEILRTYNVTTLAIDANAPLASELRPSAAWRIAYDANGALVAQR